jgi:hypothetical protein
MVLLISIVIRIIVTLRIFLSAGQEYFVVLKLSFIITQMLIPCQYLLNQNFFSERGFELGNAFVVIAGWRIWDQRI